MKNKADPHTLLSQMEEAHGKFRRVAVVGIGNELNGDDAAGILAARMLAKVSGERGLDHSPRSLDLLVIEAGLAPEAFTGPLRRYQPDLVILIDAAELGEAPGTLRWFDWLSVEGMSASTHTLPPSIFAQFLARELHCQVALAGIQPGQLDFDQAISKEVRRGVTRVVKEIRSWALL